MKKLLFLVAGALLLAGASVAWSAAGGDGPRQDRLAGGGIFGPGCTDSATPFCIPAARSFSIDAASNPEGGGAYGTYFSGRNGGGSTVLTGRVTCLAVDGDTAVAGGYVVGAAAGAPDVFFIYMQDRGTAGSAVGDRASANFVDFSTATDLPAGFPRECPPADNNAFGVGYFTLTGGDVQITDAN
ncbi:MAG TPA: hypothetical protein VLS46_00515 [Gaiellaceae bacterium]|nr:hypothetical protein [Gaiellaceae bacterium]